MIIDFIPKWRCYFPGNAAWQSAFTFLESLSVDAEPTEMVPILGDRVMARVMSYTTRTEDDAVLEAHNTYVDIQTSLLNQERIDWFPRATLTIKTAYNATSDAIFFVRPERSPISIINIPGQFVVLFPQDAHSPQLVVGSTPELVKKVVVKVKLSELCPGL